MENSRLCKLAFMAECRSGLGWWKGVNKRCIELGIHPPRPEVEFNSIAATDKDQQSAVQELMTAKAGSHMQQTYFGFKESFQLESYIVEAKNKQLRRMIANFRVGSHWLKVRSGRYDKLAHDQRFCDTCPNQVDDEMHAIFSCQAYTRLREKYADLFQAVHDLKGFLAQESVHRIALFFTECRAIKARK